MKKLLILFVLSILSMNLRAGEGEAQTLREKVNDKNYSFDVIIKPESGAVEIVPDKEKDFLPPSQMKIQFFSKKNKSLPLKLQTISNPNTIPRYEGKLDNWNNSYIGFELQFSFNRKTWKKLVKKLTP